MLVVGLVVGIPLFLSAAVLGPAVLLQRLVGRTLRWTHEEPSDLAGDDDGRLRRLVSRQLSVVKSQP